MKITHIIIGLGIGGAELMLKRLVEGLNGKDGMQHSVISLTDLGPVGQQLLGNGTHVTSLGMKNALSIPSTFIKLRRELKKQKPDIVQTWMYHADFLGGLAAKSLGINSIIWGVRTTDVTLGRSKVTVALRDLCAWLSYSVPKVIVCASDAGRKVHEKVGYDSSKMCVIHNGFDLEKLKASPEQRKTLRYECGFIENHKVIGSVGRFNKVKNQQAFVEAAVLIAAAHENAMFMMVGRDNSWENQELVSWINQYNLQKRFVLLGEREDIPVCFSAMDFFCLHSKTEGFPNVLGEAMAMGLPCVATDVGDAKLLLADTGQVVSLTVEELSYSFIHLLSLKDEQIRKIGAESKMHLHKNYTLKKTIASFLSIYNSLYDNKN